MRYILFNSSIAITIKIIITIPLFQDHIRDKLQHLAIDMGVVNTNVRQKTTLQHPADDF